MPKGTDDFLRASSFYSDQLPLLVCRTEVHDECLTQRGLSEASFVGGRGASFLLFKRHFRIGKCEKEIPILTAMINFGAVVDNNLLKRKLSIES